MLLVLGIEAIVNLHIMFSSLWQHSVFGIFAKYNLLLFDYDVQHRSFQPCNHLQLYLSTSDF